MANRADLSAVPSVLAQMPFTLNTTQDIYYHDTLNLSFKLTPEGALTLCSMVWFPAESPASHGRAISSVAPDAEFRENDSGLLSAFLFGR